MPARRGVSNDRNKSHRDHTWLFQFVGDDATNEMRLGSLQGLHQVVQLFLQTHSSIILRTYIQIISTGSHINKATMTIELVLLSCRNLRFTKRWHSLVSLPMVFYN